MEKVLLINDCRFESAVMKDKLEKLNYKVKISEEFNAMEKVLSYHPDIVVANLIMKDSNGDSLLAKIKNMNKNIICILSSCSSVKKEQYNPSFVDEVINTPVDDNKLRSILEGFNENKKVQESYAFCPFCGKHLIHESDTIKFCPFCGHSLIKELT